MNTPAIIQNALYFPQHDYYMPSINRHDYREFEYLPGHTAMTDGGQCYIHRSVVPPEHSAFVVSFDLDFHSPYQDILDKLLWGSLPQDKSRPPVHVYRPIATLTPEHLQAILDNVPSINLLHRAVIAYWATQKAKIRP